MKKRSIGMSIFLTIITLGIYGIYWFICMTDEVVALSKGKVYKTSGGVAFLKSMYIVEKEKTDYASDNSVLYLVLELFGLGIIVYALIQNSLNHQVTNEQA